MPRRHLIVRLAALGDVAMASTLARRIREQEAEAHVAWLVGRAAAPLVRLFPEVDAVHEVDDAALLRGGLAARLAVLAPLLPAVARGGWDRVYLVHADARYRVLVGGVAPGKVTMLSREYGRMDPIPGRWFGDECARLYDGGGAVHVGPLEGHHPMSDPRARLPELPEGVRGPAQGAVVLVPGGARNVLREDALRRWPAARYAALARELLAVGRHVVLVGDAGDAWVRPAFHGLPVHDLIGGLGIPETVRLMAESAVVVSHDTGPMHLARLARAPMVAMFGPTRPTERLVPDPRVRVLWGGEDLACRPCYDGREFADCAANICMSRIPVGRVMEAIAELTGA